MLCKGEGQCGSGRGAGSRGSKSEAAPEGAVSREVAEEVARQGEVVCVDGPVFCIAVGGGQRNIV